MAKYKKITPSLLLFNEHKFWRSIIQTSNKCWIWPKSLDKDGYGRFEFGTDGKLYRIRVHRASYFFHTRVFPKSNIFVCHHCDNPSCVNPNHLFLGTLQDNVDDMKKKSRGRSKLTNDQVVQIRQLLLIDVKLTYAQLAKRFNINKTTINNIANYVNWPLLYVGPIPKRSKTNDQDKNRIKELFASGDFASSIGRMFGICHHTVLSIVRNQQRSKK